MNRPELECLSAMIDGETVDPAAVRRALEAPGGVEALAQFLELRRELRLDDGAAAPTARDAPSRRPRRWLQAAALAAVLAAALLAQRAWIGRPAERVPPAAPPAAVDAAHFEPPEPDRVLRFEPGRDWSG